MKWNRQALLLPKQAGQACHQQLTVTVTASRSLDPSAPRRCCSRSPPPPVPGSTPTFVLLFSRSNLLYLLGRFHEERKDGPEPQNVDKLVAVVGALGPDHGVVQHLQRAAAGNLLLPAKGKLHVTMFGGVRSFGSHYFKKTAQEGK